MPPVNYPCLRVNCFLPLIGGTHRKGQQYFYTGKCGIKTAPWDPEQFCPTATGFSFTYSPLSVTTFSSDPRSISSSPSSSYFCALCVTFLLSWVHLQDPGSSLLSLWIYVAVHSKRSVSSACSPEFELHSFTSYVSWLLFHLGRTWC